MKKNTTILSIFLATTLLQINLNGFSQPAGYYNNAIGKSCSALKTALKDIITNGNNPKSYAALWNQYVVSDIKPRTIGTGSANVIYDVYSSIPNGTDPYQFTPSNDQCGSYNNEGDCYNREHSVPQSWFNGNTSVAGPTTDYLHIFPTDGTVNGKRGNYIYGDVATASWTSLNGSKFGSSANAGFTGNVFEPIDSFKGDLARAFLYFVTRYEDDMTSFATNAEAAQSFDASTFPSIKINYIKLMIKWHKLDPVSTKEKNRNNAAYTFQGNRNPFVDRPEYVDSVWNGSCPGLAALPVDITYFTGKLNNNSLVLNWEVGSEINLKQYDIERSFNGTSFAHIATLEAAFLYNYTYSESLENLRGRRVYYRIKKVDKNGKYSYSDVFTIHIPLNTKFSVYPNPIKNNLTIKLTETSHNTVPLQITDLAGRIVFMKNVAIVNGIINTNITNVANGTYLIKLTINNEVFTSKVIIEK